MSFERRTDRFTFFDLPRALWYFIGEERWTFLFFSAVLLTVLCYTMVPPYIVGLITNFLIDYVKLTPSGRPSMSRLYWLVGSLSVSYAQNIGIILPRLDFDQGRIVEQGSFQELAEDPTSRFGTMHAIQSV
jgi:ABC-type multidrug transport system fused ATPase/permease subunit